MRDAGCNIWKYEISRPPLQERTRYRSQSEWLRESVVVDVFKFTLGNITLSSIEKFSWLDLLSLFTWLPPNEVLRYTGEFDVTDTTYALRLLRAYVWQKELVYECTKNKYPGRDYGWRGNPDYRESIQTQLEYRKIRSLEMIEGIIKNGLYNCRQEASETSIFSCSRERQSSLLLKWLEDIKWDRIFLRELLMDITDPYYQEGL